LKEIRANPFLGGIGRLRTQTREKPTKREFPHSPHRRSGAGPAFLFAIPRPLSPRRSLRSVGYSRPGRSACLILISGREKPCCGDFFNLCPFIRSDFFGGRPWFCARLVLWRRKKEAEDIAGRPTCWPACCGCVWFRGTLASFLIYLVLHGYRPEAFALNFIGVVVGWLVGLFLLDPPQAWWRHTKAAARERRFGVGTQCRRICSKPDSADK